MYTPTQIVSLIDAMAAHLGKKPSTIARKATGSGDTYKRLTRGRGITDRRAGKIAQWLSDNWPAATTWPDSIPRPTPCPPTEPTRASVLRTVNEIMAPYVAGMNQIRRRAPGNPPSVEALTEIQQRAIETASQLNNRGHIVSPAALCVALGLRLHSYYTVTETYRDRADETPKLPPKPGTAGRKILDALVSAGDVRFRSRAAAVSWRDTRMTGTAADA